MLRILGLLIIGSLLVLWVFSPETASAAMSMMFPYVVPDHPRQPAEELGYGESEIAALTRALA